MSGAFAISVGILVFASMWACWKLGFQAGQQDIIEKYQDYYRRRCAEEEENEA
jgi:hypothetical protein